MDMQNNDYFSNEMPFLSMQTALDSSLTRALLKFQIKKVLWALFILPAFMIIAGIAFICIDAEFYLPQGVILIVAGAIIPPLTIGMSNIMQKSIDKSVKVMGIETKVYYEFYENYFKQTVDKGADFTNVSKISYKMLYMAFRTKDYYFLYPSKGQAFVLPVENMSDSQKFTLNAILEKHLGKKFKIY